VRNLLAHVSSWKPAPRRKIVYVGEPAGKSYLETAGFAVAGYDGGKLASDDLLVAGPGCGKALGDANPGMAEWIKSGGYLLALGLDQADADALLSFKVGIKRAEHIATRFTSPAHGALLAGIGPAEVHNRDPRELPLVVAGAEMLGDGVLAQSESGHVVFSQLAPWQFNGTQANLRRTRRHLAVLLARLLANMGASSPTPLLDRFHLPPEPNSDARWLTGFYQDQPEEWDDPYRFFRW
jgi:hypothetical protein